MDLGLEGRGPVVSADDRDMINNHRFCIAAEQLQLRLEKAGVRCALGIKVVGKQLVFTAILDGGKAAEVRVNLDDFARSTIRRVTEQAAMEVQSLLAEDQN